MSKTKERLIGAITVMDDTNAEKLWAYVQDLFSDPWENIPEVEPDEVDLQMLENIKADPDCYNFTT